MKKVLSIAAALVLLCVGTAFATEVTAAAVPSKTTGDMTQVTAIAATNPDVTLDPSFVVAPVEEYDATAAIAAMTEAAAKAPVIEFFGEETKTAAAALLPEGSDLTALTVTELIPMTAFNYDPSYGDVEVTMTCATEFKDGELVVAMVGIEDDKGEIAWYALAARVENGEVFVSFTQEVLEQMEGKTVLVAVLSAAQA